MVANIAFSVDVPEGEDVAVQVVVSRVRPKTLPPWTPEPVEIETTGEEIEAPRLRLVGGGR